MARQPGHVTEFPLLSPHRYPSGIAAGPDGNLWFTEGSGKTGCIWSSSSTFEQKQATSEKE